MEFEDTRLYGEIAYVLDRIFEKCEAMEGGWDDMLNMVAAVDDTKFTTQEELYQLYYKFMRNIYWRLNAWKEPQKFNQVRRKEVIVKGDKIKHVPGFTIWNYDYKMYWWALKNGHGFGINPCMIDVAEEELTPAELKQFEQKAEKNK